VSTTKYSILTFLPKGLFEQISLLFLKRVRRASTALTTAPPSPRRPPLISLRTPPPSRPQLACPRLPVRALASAKSAPSRTRAWNHPASAPRPPWPRHRWRICASRRPRPPPSPPPTPSPPSASSSPSAPPSSALPAHCNHLLTMLAWDGDGDAVLHGLCPFRRLQHLLCHRHLRP
jgi:hypothetical protein